MGLRAFEVFFPTLIEFHETGMGLVAKDDLRIAAGLRPIAALLGFARRERMLVIVPFVLDKEFVGTGTDLFSCEGVMEMFFLCDRNLVYTLFGGFSKGSGYFSEPELSLTMSHNSKVNN